MFTPETFYCARGLYNCSASSSSPVMHIYTSLDTIDAIFTPGYLPPYFGFDSEKIKNGDFLVVRGGDGGGIVTIVEAEPLFVQVFLFIPTSTVTQETITQSNEFIGIWASPNPVLISYTSTGSASEKICQFTIPTVIQTATVSDKISLTALPVKFPLIDMSWPITVIDNGIESAGLLSLATDGNLFIRPLNGDFSGVGNSGFYGSSFSFNEIV